MRACRDFLLEVLEPCADLLHRRRLFLVGGLQILRAAERALENLDAVDRHDEGLFTVETGDITAAEAATLIEVEGVLAVGGEEMLDEHSTASAEREPFDVRILTVLRRRAIYRRCDRRSVRSDGLHAHVMSGDDVLIEERRRYFQHAGDVVEPAITLRIFRQERSRIDIERQQVLHLTRVLGAVQTVEHHVARIRVSGAGLVQSGR